MKLIVAGSRDLLDLREVDHRFIASSLYNIFEVFPDEIVSGEGGVVDKSGEKFADMEELDLTTFPADWETYGKAAGPIRNREMAEYGDGLLLIWDGESRGSANMKKEMKKLGKPVYEIILKES